MSDFPYVERLSHQELAKLLNLSADTTWPPDDSAAALRHQLDAELLPDLSVTHAMSPQEIEAYLKSYEGPTRFGAQLTAANPSLFLLKAIKHFAKQVCQDPTNPLSHDSALVLYFGSIAAALTHCRTRISEMSDTEMRQGFDWARRQAGTESLQYVFELANHVLVNSVRA